MSEFIKKHIFKIVIPSITFLLLFFYGHQMINGSMSAFWHIQNNEKIEFGCASLELPLNWWVRNTSDSTIELSAIPQNGISYFGMIKLYNNKFLPASRLKDISEAGEGKSTQVTWNYHEKIVDNKMMYGLEELHNLKIKTINETWTLPSDSIVISAGGMTQGHQETFHQLIKQIEFNCKDDMTHP